MEILFITSVAIITPDPPASRKLFVDTLGLPLKQNEGDDYYYSDHIDGAKHFGVWPLRQAAQACFGSPGWPSDRPIPTPVLNLKWPTLRASPQRPKSSAQKATNCSTEREQNPGGKRSPEYKHPKASSSASPTHRHCTKPNVRGTDRPDAKPQANPCQAPQTVKIPPNRTKQR